MDDPDLEGEERFDLRLVSASSGVTVSVGSIVTVTILESDQPVKVLPVVVVVTPTLSPSSVTLSEGGSVTLEIVLESASSVDVTLTLVLENEVDGVTIGDYSLTPSEVFISAGTTSTLVLLTALDDPDLEGEERFDLRLVSASSGVTVAVGSIVTVTIIDNDEAPAPHVEIGFDSATYRVEEDAGTVELTVSVLSGMLTETVALSYETFDVSATAGSDYTSRMDTLTLSEMTMSVTFSVTIIDDDALESAEAFTVELSGASAGIRLNPSMATVLITAKRCTTCCG